MAELGSTVQSGLTHLTSKKNLLCSFLTRLTPYGYMRIRMAPRKQHMALRVLKREKEYVEVRKHTKFERSATAQTRCDLVRLGRTLFGRAADALLVLAGLCHRKAQKRIFDVD